MDKVKSLHDIGLKYETDKAVYHKYCDFYEDNLPGRNFKGRILEVGVWMGASIRMWREYYKKAQVFGIDIHIKCTDISKVSLIEMDATDELRLQEMPMMDIIVDDASHMTGDQQKTFNYLYNHRLNKGGLYIMEDLQTSYMPEYINTPKTTYDILKKYKNVKEYRGNDNQSITMIIPKLQ